MAGGPIFPYSAVPMATNGTLFEFFAGPDNESTMGVADGATITTDEIWRLFFEMPQVLPSDTCKLRLRMRANAITGRILFDPKWASTETEEDPQTVASEGDTTITWGTGDAWQWKESKITLDAFTGGIKADEILQMDLTLRASQANFDLAVISGYIASIIWEA